jgi:hypothetical protein
MRKLVWLRHRSMQTRRYPVCKRVSLMYNMAWDFQERVWRHGGSLLSCIAMGFGTKTYDSVWRNVYPFAFASSGGANINGLCGAI